MSQLQFTSIGLGDTPSNPFSLAHQTAPYEISEIETEYEWASGIGLLPVAKPGATPNSVTPSVIVQTSSPFGYKRVSFLLQRLGTMPKLPDWEPDNDNQVFANGKIKFTSPQVEPNATKVYRVEGFYLYLLKMPISVSDGIFHVGDQPALGEETSPGVTSSQFGNLTPTGGSESPG